AWLSPQVGGLILLGALVLVGFVLAESRAREPIMPLDLFRDRTYSASQAAVFLIAVAMFTAVIFLPRYYQAVRGVSATASGYEIWPLLLGLIGGSMVGGLLISKRGRYRWLLTGSAVLLIAGAALMTRLDATTGNQGSLTAVADIGGPISAALPPAQHDLVGRIVTAVHDAFAASVAQMFWLSLAASALALVAIVVLRDVPLRGGRHGSERDPGD